VDDPTELLGKRLDFRVEIPAARLNEELYKDTYVEYAIVAESGDLQIFTSKVDAKVSNKPEYTHVQHHTYKTLTKQQLNFLLNHNLCINLCGKLQPRRASALLDPNQIKMIRVNDDGANKKSPEKPKSPIVTMPAIREEPGKQQMTYAPVGKNPIIPPQDLQVKSGQASPVKQNNPPVEEKKDCMIF